MAYKKMVDTSRCDLYVSCLCGITWKIPLGKGKGLCNYDFRCDGTKGCRRFMCIGMEDHRIVDVLGIGSWWLKEKS